MPSKKYVPAPIEAYQFKAGNEAQLKEFEKIGVSVNSMGNTHAVTGPGGNTTNIEDGSYITIDAQDNVRAFNKEYFETHYIEQGAK